MPTPDPLQPSLFEEPLDRHEQFLQEAGTLAAALPPELRFGTSSWTYPGWTGLVYRRHYPKSGAAAAMLAEYARCPLFRAVGVDSFFYRPPSPEVLRDYRAAVPSDFPLVMKVWDRITSYALNSPRHQMMRQAGASPATPSGSNPDWLNPSLCLDAVIGPALEHLGQPSSVFLFEFEAIPRSAHMDVSTFAERLDRFFGALPQGPRYAIEIRTPEYLAPPYFDVLRAHGVAHVFNSWTRMPRIGAQLGHEGALTAGFTVARALLRPGRTYNEAVDAFAPYDRIREAYPEGQDDLVELVRRAVGMAMPIIVVVNNRLEGSSPLSIAALARRFLRTGA